MKRRVCKRCGDCCHDMAWETEYPLEEIEALKKKAKNKAELRKLIFDDHEKFLKTFGLSLKKHISIKYRKKDVLVESKIDKCKHLGYKDGKAFCKNHKNRSDTCKNYFCTKASR